MSGRRRGAGGEGHPFPATATIFVTPRPLNIFVPNKTFGAGVDGYEQGEIEQIYTLANLRAMRSAGFGPLTYRLRTELAVEAWHWNPRGAWSDPAHRQGYWTSNDDSPTPILASYGYKLPRRGDTFDQANNDGYSRLDDGDPKTFWKSNPYLEPRYMGEDDARHPQWVLVNLGKPRPIDALQIQWAMPYAVRYHAEYWDNPNNGDSDSIDDTFDPDGHWRVFPGSLVTNGTGGRVTLRLCPKPRPIRYVRLI